MTQNDADRESETVNIEPYEGAPDKDLPRTREDGSQEDEPAEQVLSDSGELEFTDDNALEGEAL